MQAIGQHNGHMHASLDASSSKANRQSRAQRIELGIGNLLRVLKHVQQDMLRVPPCHLSKHFRNAGRQRLLRGAVQSRLPVSN